MVDENCWVVVTLSTKFTPGSSVTIDQLNAGRKLAPVKQLCVTVEATVTVSPAKNFPSLRKSCGSSTFEMAGGGSAGGGRAPPGRAGVAVRRGEGLVGFPRPLLGPRHAHADVVGPVGARGEARRRG